MSFSAFWNSPYRPSLTTTQIILRIITLILLITCLGITIYLALHFLLTYLIVYIALMFSILISESSIVKLISKPSHGSVLAEHGVLIGSEALVLVYWVIILVLIKMGLGLLDSADNIFDGDHDFKRQKKFRWIHQGLIIVIIVLHTLLLSLGLFSAYLMRRTLIRQQRRLKYKSTYTNTLRSSEHTSGPSLNTTHSTPVSRHVEATSKPAPQSTPSDPTSLDASSRHTPVTATPERVSQESG